MKISELIRGAGVKGDTTIEGSLTITGNTTLGNDSTDSTTLFGKVRLLDLPLGDSNTVVIQNNDKTLETRVINSVVWDTSAVFVAPLSANNFGTIDNISVEIGTGNNSSLILGSNTTPTTIQGSLSVLGNTTLGNSPLDLININGTLNVNNDLIVHGNTTLGNTSADLTTINGNLSVKNNAIIDEDLFVKGNLIIDGTNFKTLTSSLDTRILALDTKTNTISSSLQTFIGGGLSGSTVNIGGSTNTIILGGGTNTTTVSGNLITTSNASISGSLNVGNVIYTPEGNSNQWTSTFTTVQSNSGKWDYQGTDLKTLSSNWQNTFTTVQSNSGKWDYQGTDLKTLSSNWQNTFTTVQSNSGKWDLGTEENFIIACSDETTNLNAILSIVTFRMPYQLNLLEVKASVNTSPVSQPIIIDINCNGVSIFSSRLVIDAAQTTSKTSSSPYIIINPLLPDDSVITIDTDQVGGISSPGNGLKVTFKGRRIV
jgi:hypothetical protein